MLVINRKVSEQILINENIKLVILSVKGKYVTIGIEADKDVSVTRPDAIDKVKKPSVTKV